MCQGGVCRGGSQILIRFSRGVLKVFTKIFPFFYKNIFTMHLIQFKITFQSILDTFVVCVIGGGRRFFSTFEGRVYRLFTTSKGEVYIWIFRSQFQKLETFFYIFSIYDSAAILVTIFVANMDLQITCIFHFIFHACSGLVMVKNIYLDTKIVAVDGFLQKLEQFFYMFHSLGGHFGDHFGTIDSLLDRSHALQIPYTIDPYTIDTWTIDPLTIDPMYYRSLHCIYFWPKSAHRRSYLLQFSIQFIV